VLWTAGSIFKTSRGSLERCPAERVRFDLDRWIRFRGSRLDPEREERRPAGIEETPGGAMAGVKLTSPEFGV